MNAVTICSASRHGYPLRGPFKRTRVVLVVHRFACHEAMEPQSYLQYSDRIHTMAEFDRRKWCQVMATADFTEERWEIYSACVSNGGGVLCLAKDRTGDDSRYATYTLLHTCRQSESFYYKGSK